MTPSQILAIERSEKIDRINALKDKENRSEDETRELDGLTKRVPDIGVEFRAALVVEGDDLETAKTEAGGIDPEMRERISLREKASVSNFLTAAARGRLPDGPEAELIAAAGTKPGSIPIELWDLPENRSAEERAVTGSPGTVGVNLDPIRPAVFANSIAARLMVEMPRVASGTYASATISTSQSAEAKDKGADIAATAGLFTVTTATPKRVSARLELTLEDIAAVGQANFESILRQNLALALSDALDSQIINGDGVAPNLAGFFNRLTDPGAPGAAIATFDDFVSAFADGIDGLWANTVSEVAIVAGVDTYKLAAKTFRDIAAADLGAESFADYAMRLYGGFWTNKRMPAVDNDIQQAILCRKGRSAEGANMGMRTAVIPHWGSVDIDDVYSGSAKAERYFTMHVLLGDVIIVQPDAYSQVSFRTAV